MDLGKLESAEKNGRIAVLRTTRYGVPYRLATCVHVMGAAMQGVAVVWIEGG